MQTTEMIGADTIEYRVDNYQARRFRVTRRYVRGVPATGEMVESDDKDAPLGHWHKCMELTEAPVNEVCK